MSTRTLDFSRHYATRAHQTQRSGPVLGSLPSLHEVEDMINVQRQNQEALMRIRTAVLNQEHAMAEQMAQRKAFKSNGIHDDELAMYQDEFKGSGGFAGADAKKRRGVRFFFPVCLCVPVLTFYRKPPLQDVATAAIEPKLRNGDGDRMEPERCAMHAAYTMRN